MAFVFKCSGRESRPYKFLRILPEVAHEKPPFERSVLRDGQGPNRSLKKESVRIFLANLVDFRNCGTVGSSSDSKLTQVWILRSPFVPLGCSRCELTTRS